MSDICLYCDEPLQGDVVAVGTEEGPRYTHVECSLRMVIGGIGHLIAHEWWCIEHRDPDAGLTYHQSAQLVAAWVRIVGIETMEGEEQCS